MDRLPAQARALGERTRLLALDVMAGERTTDAAARYGVSQARVSQVLRELEMSWHRFHGEPVG